MFDSVSRSGIKTGLSAGMAFAPAMTGMARQSINLSANMAAINPHGTQSAVDTHARQLGSIDQAIKTLQAQSNPSAKPDAPKSVGRQMAGAAIGAMAFSVGGPLGAMMAMGDAIKIGGAAMAGVQHDTSSAPKLDMLATRHETRGRNGKLEPSFASISLKPNNDSGYDAATKPAVDLGDIRTARSSLKDIKGVKPAEQSQQMLKALTLRRREEMETLSIADRLGFNVSVATPLSKLSMRGPTMGGRRGGLAGMAMGMAA